ncbi:hypothetical protein ACOSQ3_027190 [Xanthoceras sorbifolium]
MSLGVSQFFVPNGVPMVASLKARLVTKGFHQSPGVNFYATFRHFGRKYFHGSTTRVHGFRTPKSCLQASQSDIWIISSLVSITQLFFYFNLAL